ncbi:MAG: c-type heme family protein [Thermodesulfobacteriota bacterium]
MKHNTVDGRHSLSTYVVGGILLFFLLTSAIVVVLVRETMRERALADAQSKAKIILDRTMATHDYFSNDLKPAIFALTDKSRPAGYFDPVWMSSTHANRIMHRYFSARNNGAYYLKECAINARSPENEATAYERDFIKELNNDPALELRSTVLELDGQPFFVVLRRGETMQEACLRCHSTPDKAPKGLVDIYGAERSFTRQHGQTISAVSIRIPLADEYAEADRFSLRLSWFLVLALFLMAAALSLLHRFFIAKPLQVIRDKALLIAAEEKHLGERIEVVSNREFQELAEAFNTMSEHLRLHRDSLEEMVQERTRELSEALANIRTLKGLLPICSSCKKIRNDQGYWDRIETYIQTHTDASFTHGICPGCMKQLYPELMETEDGQEPASGHD